MNVLILAAGLPAFQVGGEKFPLFLTEIEGTILLQKIADQCKGKKPVKLTFVFNRQDVSKYYLQDICKMIDLNANVVSMEGTSQGAACTALYSVIDFEQSESLLIVNANQFIDLNLSDEILYFENSDVDAGLFVFDSTHPRYSYVRINEQHLVIEAAEKRPISRLANTGIFWFKKTSDFVYAVEQLIRKNASVDNIFYVTPALNELVLISKKILVKEIERAAYHPLKTEKQLNEFEQSMEHKA